MILADASPEIERFRADVRAFLSTHAPAEAVAAWKQSGRIPVDFWRRAAPAGLIGCSVPCASRGGACRSRSRPCSPKKSIGVVSMRSLRGSTMR